MDRKPKIGVSACYFHGDPTRPIFKGKTLLYLEQSLAHWVMAQGAMAYLIPSVPKGFALKNYVSELDGLVLQGGSDVSPQSYGEKPLRPEWSGDFVRDQYEIALLHQFQAERKPVLGVCRGAQLINIAFGGTLYQDIGLQVPGAREHRNWEIYDQNFHSIRFEPGSELSRIFDGKTDCKVNSIHHQGLKNIGKGLRIEARSEGDGIAEAIRFEGEPFICAVQWHPEFHDLGDRTLLDCAPLLRRFLEECGKRRD